MTVLENLPRVCQESPTGKYDPVAHAVLAAELAKLAGDAFRAGERGAHTLCKMATTHATIALAFCATAGRDV